MAKAFPTLSHLRALWISPPRQLPASSQGRGRRNRKGHGGHSALGATEGTATSPARAHSSSSGGEGTSRDSAEDPGKKRTRPQEVVPAGNGMLGPGTQGSERQVPWVCPSLGQDQNRPHAPEKSHLNQPSHVKSASPGRAGPGSRARALSWVSGSLTRRALCRGQPSQADPVPAVLRGSVWPSGQCSTWSSSYFSQKRLVKGKQVRCSIQGQLMG